MEITLGHTPDADDAFMFYGFAAGGVGQGRFSIKHVIQDIETLNKRAVAHELDVTAVSAHASRAGAVRFVTTCSIAGRTAHSPCTMVSSIRATRTSRSSRCVSAPRA